jgi:ADP-L-glycero-D-manno-heptose 6-epimerase
VRCIVTGGAGFIGSNLAMELEARGAQVTVVDNFRSGHFENLQGFRGDVITTDDRALETCKADGIFHLASITDTTVHDPATMMSNVEGLRRILELARRWDVPVVYASSAATYGNSAAPNREDAPPTPANIYGFSKVIMENVAREYSSRGVHSVGLRFFNVFGPREEHKGHASSMIYQLACQMLSGKRPRIFKMGEQKRDHVYVKDVVEVCIRAMSVGETTVLNVGTGQATSFNEIVAHLNKALGLNLEPDYFDNPYTEFYQNFTQADVSRLKATVGFVPRPTAQGIAEYAQHIKKAFRPKK